MAGGREAVIDYEFLRGRQNETIVKELRVARAAASETFRFKSPYKMADHGSSENGIKWADGYIEYKELHTVLNEAVACFALLYAYGVSKCTFLAGLTGRPIHNLEDVNCLPPVSFNHKSWCTMTCHKFPTFSCATKTTHSLYDWLIYYLQKKDYVQSPTDMTRHTAEFVAAI
jgi:hypothetical protein